MPFEQALPAGAARWDDLPAAHARGDRVRPALRCCCCSCSGAGCAGRRSGSRSPTRGRRTRSRSTCSNSNSNDALVARCSCSPRCSSRRAPRRAAARRGARRADEVRAAGARAAARCATPDRARGCAGCAFLLAFVATARDRAAARCCSAARPRHGLRPHDRLPGRARLAVLGLGLYGGLGRRRSTLVQARRRRCSRSALAFVPRRRDIVRPRRAVRRGPDRAAARRDPLVLPLHRRGSSRWSCSRCSAATATGAACSIARRTARRPARRLQRDHDTPLSHGSSSEVSKRIGMCVRSDSIACSFLTPITPPRGPVMPTSVM